MDNIYKPKRIEMLDALKAIAILLMVLIHVFQRTIPNFNTNDCWWKEIFYMMCTPMFIFFSGISYSRKKTLSPKGFIFDAFKRTLLYFWPFLLYILLCIGIYNQWKDIGDAFNKLMEYPVEGLWVCWILLWITLTMDIGLLLSNLFPKFRKAFVVLMFSIGLTIIIVLRNYNIITSDHFIGYDYFILCIPTFTIGYLIGDWYFKIKKLYISLPLSLASIFSLIILCFNIRTLMNVKFFEVIGYMYLGTVLSILTYLGIITLLTYLKKTEHFLSFCGKYTMEVYCVHIIVLKSFSRLYYENGWLTAITIIGLILLCFATTIAVVSVSYVIPFLHLLLFGKHYSYYSFENKIFYKLNCFMYDLKTI